jgi:hypothetical protein
VDRQRSPGLPGAQAGCSRDATASPITGELPLFLTVTETRGQGAHTDVSLWYLLTADTVTSYDQEEFNAIRWLTDEQVLDESDELLDPHMHRFFTHKLQDRRPAWLCLPAGVMPVVLCVIEVWCVRRRGRCAR